MLTTDVCLATTTAMGSDVGMKLAYRIVNVFTVEDDRLSGNPLCVFEDANLPTAQMQALARQLNLSETTFIHGSRVRIFTPSFEMPFAGHPTLGTAHVMRAMRGGDRQVLEENVGPVEVTADGDRWTLRAAKPPVTRPAASREQLSEMLGGVTIVGEPLWVNTGAEQLVIPLASADEVRRAKPVPELMHRHAQGANEAMAYVWAREADHLLVRFFFDQQGSIVEDPATGSACANLGGYFLATGAALPVTELLHQGEAVRRPSHLGLRVTTDRQIYVSGKVVELGTGSFDV